MDLHIPPDSTSFEDLSSNTPLVKLPGFPQAGASRKRNLIFIVPLDPAHRAGLAGHLPVTPESKILLSISLSYG
jgi:hypothetical protein